MSLLIRARSVQRADLAALDDLCARGVTWERQTQPWQRVFEVNGTIVATSAHAILRITRPTFAPEPVPELDEPWSAGDERALVGCGLVLGGDLPAEIAHNVHRLARTLPAQEHGVHWCLVCATMPAHPNLDPAGLLQQIAAGRVAIPAVTIPIVDGYWPIGTHRGDAVLARYQKI